MAVNPIGSACGCGSFGCWETEIGERALLTQAGREPGGGRQAVDDLIAAAAAGDPQALAGLEHVGRWLGIGLVSLVNVFNPTLVVLGGIFERIHPHISESVEAVLDRRALAASRELIRVSPGSLGVDGPLIGAAELAFEPMLADPAARLAAVRAGRLTRASA